jgi:hypothetical protein
MGALGWLTQIRMLEEDKITSREGRDSSASFLNIRGKYLFFCLIQGALFI